MVKKRKQSKQMELKSCQQANKSVKHTRESLLANQKVGTMGRLKHSMMKQAHKIFNQCFSLHHHFHLGATYINVTLVVPDGSLGCQQQDQKQVDVFGSGNNIAETINSNINTNKTTDDGE